MENSLEYDCTEVTGKVQTTHQFSWVMLIKPLSIFDKFSWKG